MKLSIVTINYNDAVGLKRTLDSVAAQQLATSPSRHLATSPMELEHVIVDGGSTDGSVDVIKEYEKRLMEIGGALMGIGVNLKWISEKDNGVYNAMNKGIKMATGDYIQILNSGDILASNDVLVKVRSKMEEVGTAQGKYPEILYGNMLKTKDGVHVYKDNCGRYNGTPESFLYFYRGTMNHDTAWIMRSLFVSDNQQSAISNQQCFGLYDEEMKICSDWKWYVNAVALGLGVNGERLEAVKPVYVDVDVTIFDMNGISESGGKNRALIQKERREYLEQVLPASVLRDYDEFAMPIEQYRRLKRYHLWGVVYFVERVLFKLEKWGLLR